ncbi:ribonuclease T2 [Clupea harengus]|uniref:Ribonuclease T2 n=1 Tax=Clupea harengus TaxID=7950 RepID=A0A6P3WDJ6_CLUHA|nr:ribonuclease T2 [Clupea harengus]
MRAFELVTLLCLGLASSTYIPLWKPWTKLILTHHWPETFCTMEHCKEHYKYWTLHGLWPNIGIACNSSWKFNMSEIQDLKPDMDKYWPNLLHPTSAEFWKYEWHKHGTCAATSESLNSQHKYFSKALELYKMFDLTGVLTKAGIVPAEQNYQTDAIEAAIEKAFGAKPKIQCVHPSAKAEQVQQLGQIEICVNSDFKPIDCEKSEDDLWSRVNDVLLYRFRGVRGFSVCDLNMPVHYPLPMENF